MPSFSHLLVGLGNPGDDYARTRHNIGFMVVDAIADRHPGANWKKKFRGLVAQTDNVLLLKPHTYMNLSGESVREACDFYQINPDQVVVFHDDIDLKPSEIRVKQAGGAGGHNGLKSLDTHITAQYWRVRLGVGRPMTEQGFPVKGDAVSDYVLNPFSKADKAWLEPLIEILANESDLLVRGDIKSYVARVTRA